MRCTDTEMMLVVKQLRRAREEVVRAKLLMQAIANDDTDAEAVRDLTDMADGLAAHVEALVKADEVDEGEDAEE